jgi:hypothetical protein
MKTVGVEGRQRVVGTTVAGKSGACRLHKELGRGEMKEQGRVSPMCSLPPNFVPSTRDQQA